MPVSLSAGCLCLVGATHSFPPQMLPEMNPSIDFDLAPVPMSDRNPYGPVPHLSPAKESTDLINHQDWWRSVFVVIERSHKYLISAGPSDSRSAPECPSLCERGLHSDGRWPRLLCRSYKKCGRARSIFLRFGKKRSCGLQRNLNSEEGTLNKFRGHLQGLGVLLIIYYLPSLSVSWRQSYGSQPSIVKQPLIQSSAKYLPSQPLARSWSQFLTFIKLLTVQPRVMPRQIFH